MPSPRRSTAEVDGVAALETVRELGRFHRVQGSPGFAAAAEMMKQKAIAAGPVRRRDRALPRRRKDEVRALPLARGLGPGHRHARGGLADAAPDRRVPRPPRRARGLQPGRGRHAPSSWTSATAPSAEGLRGQGRARKDRPRRRRRCPPSTASPAKSAAPRASSPPIPNQTTPWSGDDRDLVRWGHLSPYQLQNRFAFMVSKRQAEELRARLSAGEKDRPAARVEGEDGSGHLRRRRRDDPGNGPAAGEVVLTAHLCHESAGANDNASGSAAILEVARALAAAIRKQALPPPRRTIRFLWLPEITGSQAYLARHPEIVARLVAGVHMDMVGGLLATTKGTFHLSRTAERLPARRQRRSPRRGSTRSSAASARYAEGRRRRVRRIRLAAGIARGVPRRHPRPRDGQRPRGLRGRGLPRARWSTSTTTPTSRSTRRRTSPRTSTRRSSAASPTWAPGSSGPSPRCPEPRPTPCSP